MTSRPAARGLALGRAGAILVLSLPALTGCGLAGDADPAPAPVVTVTTSASAQSVPSQDDPGQGDQVEPGGVLTDGSTVAAELTRVGQKDTYTLDLGDAREFYVSDMRGDDIQLQVFSEVDGEPLVPSAVALSHGTAIFKLTKAGAHRLEVRGNTNVIGAYGFRIATVKIRTFPVTVGLRIAEGSPDGAGRLDVPGRIDRFEFDSDGATAVKILGGSGACTAIELELHDAAETSVAEARQPIPLCGYEFDIPLTGGDGRYALVVKSGEAKTGAYSFQLVRAG